MNLSLLGLVSTGLVVLAGLGMILPFFFQEKPSQTPVVVLSFELIDDPQLQNWCRGLSRTLEEHGVGAMVFLSGTLATKFPNCVNSFDDAVDIGSQTFSYTVLPRITDYSEQLYEVRMGKLAIDDVGNLYSRMFKAPTGEADGDIYSLLSRSDIIADLSYPDYYTLYRDGLYVPVEISSVRGLILPPDFYSNLSTAENLTILNFYSTDSLDAIDQVILELTSRKIDIVSLSEITGINLTTRIGL